MTIEINYEETANEQVHMFFSPVVEGMIILCALLLKNKKDFQYIECSSIEKELPESSRVFIEKWHTFATVDLLGCLDLLLKVPHFQDEKDFCAGITALSDIDFAQGFLGGEIPKDLLDRLLTSPQEIDSVEERYEWSSPEKRHFTKTFLLELDSFRKEFLDAFLHILHGDYFQKLINSKQAVIDQPISELKKLNMKPLALSQYVMGKTFKRTSDYKLYYFFPSYSFSPFKIRVFNHAVCIVIFGCAKPLNDDREKSKDLSRTLKVLSDPNRLLILRMLCIKKEYGARLAEYVGLTTATVSHHLDLLKKANLIKEEKIGAIKYFSADPVQLEKFKAVFQEFTNTET
ncbi:helix-turn-helix transcriptional regulator [Bacillus sp. FJAT-27445]|uniref:ArsR/SmtB family transcription factor n=1 Tax=Bacillus sp. FJAT-27445 TaxID=1679166 RepID=UPI0007441389|nr:metalloregulator ArsR/SmtB family transcription factor [Bacillus sp. FJAT-27445]